jgi:hypothetical protein
MNVLEDLKCTSSPMEAEIGIEQKTSDFTKAIMDMEKNNPELLRLLGIKQQWGTVMRISIANVQDLWSQYNREMFKVQEELEKLVKLHVEDQGNGIIVKVTEDHSIICFFVDGKDKSTKAGKQSMLNCMQACYMIEYALKNEPIMLKENVPLRLHIYMCHGAAYRRTVHIQKKVLYDYHGSLVDQVAQIKVSLSEKSDDKSVNYYVCSKDWKRQNSEKKRENKMDNAEAHAMKCSTSAV